MGISYLSSAWYLEKSFASSTVFRSPTVLIGSQVDDYTRAKPNFELETANDIPGYISVFEIGRQRFELFPIPLFIHSFNQLPKKPEQIVGISKWTPSGLIWNWRTKKIERLISAPSNYRFFGHSCFSPDGDFCYVTGQSSLMRKGVVFIFDARNWSLLKMIELPGAAPHEIINGSDGCFTVGINVKDGFDQVLKINTLGQIVSATNSPRVVHLTEMANNEFVLGAAAGKDNSLGLSAIHLDSQRLVDFKDSIDFPAGGMNGEALSFAKVSESEVFVTFGAFRMFGLWNIRSNRMKFIPLADFSLGVSQVGDSLFVTTGSHQLVEYKDAQQFSAQPEIKSVFPFRFGNGPHLKAMKMET